MHQIQEVLLRRVHVIRVVLVKELDEILVQELDELLLEVHRRAFGKRHEEKQYRKESKENAKNNSGANGVKIK